MLSLGQQQGEITSLDSTEKLELSPRLDDYSIDQSPTPIQDDPPSLTLDSDSYLTPLTPDLPSESFSPFLTASRLVLNTEAPQQAPRLGLTNSKSADEASPLVGLGILGMTRKDDSSRAFDGLGIVHVRSSPWRSRRPFDASDSSGNFDSAVHIQPDDLDDDNSRISDTFLHDLESFFLARDSTDGGGPTLDFIVEEPKFTDVDGEEGFLAPHMSTPKRIFKTAVSLTPRTPSRPPSNLCATISGPNLRRSTSTTLAVPLVATLPRSSTTSSCSALTRSSSLSPSGSLGISTLGSSQGSAGFARSTCSAFNKPQRDRIYSSPFPSRTNDSRGAVPTVSPARNLTVSVSMGPASGGGGLSMGNRSLQSHSVRDLSVVGTISSDLKKKAPVPQALSASASSFSLKCR